MTRKKRNIKKMTINLPKVYHEAMNLVWDTDRVQKSFQVELGLRLYFEKYRELLKANELDVWSNNFE